MRWHKCAAHLHADDSHSFIRIIVGVACDLTNERKEEEEERTSKRRRGEGTRPLLPESTDDARVAAPHRRLARHCARCHRPPRTLPDARRVLCVVHICLSVLARGKSSSIPHHIISRHTPHAHYLFVYRYTLFALESRLHCREGMMVKWYARVSHYCYG